MGLYLTPPSMLTRGTMIGCVCYACVLFGFLAFRKFISQRQPQRSGENALLLVLAFWIVLAPTCLYAIVYVFNLFHPFLAVYVLLALIMAVALRLVGELMTKGTGVFMAGMYGGLLLLCTFVVMPECVYNILVLGNVLPITSPFLGMLSFGIPIAWIVIEFLGERWLKKLWHHLLYQHATTQD